MKLSDVNDRIDDLLSECGNKGSYSKPPNISKEELEAVRISLTMGYLEKTFRPFRSHYKLTKLGSDIVNLGGYKKFLEKMNLPFTSSSH